MKIKTNDLTGPALDWAVAKLEFDAPAIQGGVVHAAHEYIPWAPSTDWAQGGPIKEREKIATFYQTNGRVGAIKMATKEDPHPAPWFGLTELIAAMRCYVASRLGDEVDVPEELT